VWWLTSFLWCFTFCWKCSKVVERGGSMPRPEALRTEGSALLHRGSMVCRVRIFSFCAYTVICITDIIWHRSIAPNNGMHSMIPSHLLLIYAKHVLRGHFLKFKLILHILRGSPCIHAVKSSIFKLNVSFNCVVNIYQKEGDCKCNQALSGFWWCWWHN